MVLSSVAGRSLSDCKLGSEAWSFPRYALSIKGSVTEDGGEGALRLRNGSQSMSVLHGPQLGTHFTLSHGDWLYEAEQGMNSCYTLVSEHY